MPLLIIILYALFGFTFTLGKLTLSYATPFFIVATRMIIGGLGQIGYLYWRRRDECSPAKNDVWLYAQITFFGIVFFYCARSWALQELSTTKAALLFTLLPLFTALFAYIFEGERISWRKGLGLTIGFIGMIPMLLSRSSVEEVFSLPLFSLAEFVMIASVASLSYSILVTRTLVKHRQCPPMLINGITMFMGGVISLQGALFFEDQWIIGDWKIFSLILGLQILISNILCANLQTHLLRKYSSTFMSFASFLSPLCAAFYGWLLLGETITLNFIISFGMIFVGLTLYYFDEIRSEQAV